MQYIQKFKLLTELYDNNEQEVIDVFKNELNGLKEYRYDVLSYLKNTYNVFSNLDIDTINKDVEFIEKKIAPYILSNELAEDAIQRTNKYKLTDLITKFPNINFDNEYF